MDITIRINKKEHLAYIPIRLHEILGDNPRATPNRAAVLLFAEKTSIDDALKSLDIIRRDLQHAKELEQKKAEQEVKAA